MTPPQSFVEFEWEPNSQNQEFDQTISLRGGSSSHAVDEGGVRRAPPRALCASAALYRVAADLWRLDCSDVGPTPKGGSVL